MPIPGRPESRGVDCQPLAAASPLASAAAPKAAGPTRATQTAPRPAQATARDSNCAANRPADRDCKHAAREAHRPSQDEEAHGKYTKMGAIKGITVREESGIPQGLKAGSFTGRKCERPHMRQAGSAKGRKRDRPEVRQAGKPCGPRLKGDRGKARRRRAKLRPEDIRVKARS